MALPIASSTTQRIDFVFRPLQISQSLVCSSPTGGVQTYDDTLGLYVPDNEQMPVIIDPQCGRIDKDGILSSGSINAELSNVVWTEIIDGVERTIPVMNDFTNLVNPETSAAYPVYEMVQSGALKGRLIVRKNASPLHPIVLRFTAQYVDPRNAQVYTIKQTYTLRCTDASSAPPEIRLDVAEHSIFDPLEGSAKNPYDGAGRFSPYDGQDEQIVHASLWINSTEIQASDYLLVWELSRGGSTWSEIGTEALDYFAEVASDGMSCAINKRLVGDGCTIRVRAKYDPYGNPSSVALNALSPSATFTFQRRLPKVEVKMLESPYNIKDGQIEMYPTGWVTTCKGKVDYPMNELELQWMTGVNVSIGQNVAYNLAAVGENPVIPTPRDTMMHASRGGMVRLDLADRGPFKAWTDSDGRVFIDPTDNKILLIH